MKRGHQLKVACIKACNFRSGNFKLDIKVGEKFYVSEIDGDYFIGAVVFDLVKLTKEEFDNYFKII